MNVLLTPENTPAYLIREAIEWCIDHYEKPERVRCEQRTDFLWHVRCDFKGAGLLLAAYPNGGVVIFEELTSWSNHPEPDEVTWLT